jgi:hypothetical protein
LFKYVPLSLPASCLRAMWLLTFNPNEWGAQFRPKLINGSCELSCDTPLIEGTGLEQHSDDKYYKGKNQERDVRIAVTPFYKEVFQVFPTCDGKDTINFFFHTHPLFLSSDKYGSISPPSLGDLFAHSVLSNSRNWRQNKQLNATAVMAFEGMYVYYILPHKFRQVMDRIDELVANHVFTPEEAAMWEVGEAPSAVVMQIKSEVFDSLRDINDAFGEEVLRFMQMNKRHFSIRGAPVLADSGWHCKTCPVPEMDFDFLAYLGNPDLVDFCRHNTFVQGLHERGFHYEFYPAPFDGPLKVLAPSKATLVESRELPS